MQLPKADIVQVRLSSTLLSGDLALLGLWSWAGGAIPAAQAQDGEVWMLTPFQTLTLVHAVRQPLRTPEFNKLGAGRSVGDTFATLGDVMSFSRKSTSKVEVYASWSEPIDEGPGAPTPFLRTVDQTLAFPCDIDRPIAGETEAEEELHFLLEESHEFYDTKHRSVTYTAVATTKFEEYFEPEEGPFTRETAPPPEGHGPKTLQVASAARPPAPNVLYVVPTFTWSEPAGRKARVRAAGSRVPGTAVVRHRRRRAARCRAVAGDRRRPARPAHPLCHRLGPGPAVPLRVPALPSSHARELPALALEQARVHAHAGRAPRTVRQRRRAHRRI